MGSREKRERREARTRYSSAMARVAITRAKAPRMTSRTQMNRATVKVAGGVIAAAAARNVVCRAASTDVLDKVRGIISEQLGADLDKVSPQEYLELAEKHMQLHFPNAKLLPGVEKLILHLKANNIPIAISTGSSNESFDLKTKNLKTFFDMFDPVVKCGSDPEVKNGKPAPDAFEVARLRFSPQPKASSCLAFEDAPNGVESALKAGMQVIMIPDPSTPLANVKQ